MEGSEMKDLDSFIDKFLFLISFKFKLGVSLYHIYITFNIKKK